MSNGWFFLTREPFVQWLCTIKCSSMPVALPTWTKSFPLSARRLSHHVGGCDRGFILMQTRNFLPAVSRACRSCVYPATLKSDPRQGSFEWRLLPGGWWRLQGAYGLSHICFSCRPSLCIFLLFSGGHRLGEQGIVLCAKAFLCWPCKDHVAPKQLGNVRQVSQDIFR